jgi:hypothetical protein
MTEISMSYPIVAYKIMPSLDHLDTLPEDPMDKQYGEAEDYDAITHKPTDPERSEALSWGGMTSTILYPGSEPINFVGFLDRLPHQTDFLSTDGFGPIISKRMLYVLNSLGDFPHKAISTRIYDYRFQDQGDDSYGRHDYEGPAIAPRGEFNEDYVSLQLLEHVDGIDYEHSEFELNPDPENLLPDLVLQPDIIDLVLKEPVGGFPPIFRLNRAGERVLLFVSPTAKEALEEAGIKGLRFTEYEGTRAQEASAAR